MKFFKKIFKQEGSQNSQTIQRARPPDFVGKRTTPGGTYEVYRAVDAESAKSFLHGKKVSESKYYIKVETPEGNWGVDIDGLYLETLQPFQRKIENAEHEGRVYGLPNAVGLQYAANKVSDNFTVEVECGGCGHQWIDGLRYQDFTIVRCPQCDGLNKVDSRSIRVVSGEAPASPQPEEKQPSKPAEKVAVSRFGTILTDSDTLVLCAFLVETKSGAGAGGFQKTVVIQASEGELEQKIRSQCSCPEAKVLIVPPDDWNPPMFRSVSQQEMAQHFPMVLSRAADFLQRNGRGDLDVQELVKTGTVMPNPVSGKVFFVFKIPQRTKGGLLR
jgi:hypothetical protein